MAASAPRLDTAPVLAVLVSHGGDERDLLDALRGLTVRPRHLLAVDAGASTSEELARARRDGLVDGVLELPAGTGFGPAVAAALDHATDRWGDPGRWLWLLHDDSVPEPDCLENLLRVADLDSTAAMLGPLGLDRDDPRLVVDAGLSTDSSGNRQTGIGPSELDPALGASGSALAVSEVLAVSSAGALVRRDVFQQLGGFDAVDAFADIDLGWRINTDGHLVLFVPSARMRHAGTCRKPGTGTRKAGRVNGVRTFLVNTTLTSFLIGLPRLFVLALLRTLGFTVLRRWPEALAELAVLGSLLTGRLGLLSGRRRRAATISKRHGVRGLLTSRLTRLRNGLRAAFAGLVRERVRRDFVLGQASEQLKAVPATAPRAVGPDALPAGAVGKRVAGLRRPAAPVVVPVEPAPTPSPRPRPSPVPRGGTTRESELLLVPVDRWRVLRELLLTPPVVLAVALLVFALVTNGVLAEMPRFGPGLHGGQLLPVGDLGRTWADYLAAWHPVDGGTASPASPSLLVLAVLGSVLGGPPVVVSILLLFGVPLAGIAAYLATRAVPISRAWRATAAGAYALLPAAVLSAGHGRLDVVVAHILVPPLLAGISAAVGLSRLAPVHAERNWLGTACLTSLGLAVLGAFTPLMHAALVVLALLGFVLVPSEARRAPRRVAALTAIVLLPVACLLPWPIVLAGNPRLLLAGPGQVSPWLLALTPSAEGWAGGLLVLAVAAVLIRGRRRPMVPGLAVMLFGWVLAVLVPTGAPLILVAAGAMWAVLAGKPSVHRAVPACVLAVLTAGAVLAGIGGPLTTQQATTTPALTEDLQRPGYLLLLGPGPARLVDGTHPRYGDDALVRRPTSADWLRRVDADLRSGDRDRVRGALAATAARSAGFVAAPPLDAARVREVAGDLVQPHGHLASGEDALRVLLPSSPVALLGPDLARQARAEAAPTPEAKPLPVDAVPPDFAVRVSDGGVGRALVLGAENEPGWYARINGAPAPLATTWGHQVAVPLPEHTADVEVGYEAAPRTALLVVQAAANLFALVGALPERRRRVTAPR
ncbi:glycosyltransferase family 2 protein [Saccharopolyspora taberi]|uniref:Glycosyltransferase family 2 protein n=1 Tax=Saccharopolyspora taberi TaxID=60895 RepID=A0ABN3VM51_9PSEU